MRGLPGGKAEKSISAGGSDSGPSGPASTARLNSRPSMNCSAKQGRPDRAARSASRSPQLRRLDVAQHRVVVHAARALVPDALDDPRRITTSTKSRSEAVATVRGSPAVAARRARVSHRLDRVHDPRRRGQPRLPQPLLGQQLVRGQEERFRAAAGIGQAQHVQHGRGEVDQRVGLGQRFDQVEDHVRPQPQQFARAGRPDRACRPRPSARAPSGPRPPRPRRPGPACPGLPAGRRRARRCGERRHAWQIANRYIANCKSGESRFAIRNLQCSTWQLCFSIRRRAERTIRSIRST